MKKSGNCGNCRWHSDSDDIRIYTVRTIINAATSVVAATTYAYNNHMPYCIYIYVDKCISIHIFIYITLPRALYLLFLYGPLQFICSLPLFLPLSAYFIDNARRFAFTFTPL